MTNTLNPTLADLIAPRHPSAYSVAFPDLSTIKPANGSSKRALKICIATEDIVGPIRNGGIGTTYTHLSFLLSQAGHDVTIYYLRGKHAEGNDIGRWIKWYKERGVRFVPVDPGRPIRSPANRWIQPMLALYNKLKEEHFDVVHSSEWRGTAYLCLLAKKQGLAFNNTIFCIKTSSPWLWNRETCLRPLEETGDLVKIFAERRSVELADLVIGGSAYLLHWMLDHGYRLPENRTFVQPNVVKPVELPKEITANRPEYGSRVPIKEIVFFGRLEHRKGLEIFCEAINNLRREGVKLPPITFMGKFGSRIPSHSDLSVEEFIKLQTRRFDIPIKILFNKNQFEGLRYLHGEGILAVMPSLAENSTLTVYETTHFAIPFIATDVGGTAELIANEHKAAVLVDIHPLSLTNKLKEVLDIGGMVAAPSFDNDVNLELWRQFHANLASIIDNNDMAAINLDTHRGISSSPLISICLVLRDDHERLDRSISSLTRQKHDSIEILLVDDGSEEKSSLDWLEQLEHRIKSEKLPLKIFQTARQGPPEARNYAALKAQGDYLLFVDTNSHPTSRAIETLSHSARHSNADLFQPFYDECTLSEIEEESSNRQKVIFLTGDPSLAFFEPSWTTPVFLVRKSIFHNLGGFTTDYKIPGSIEEFIHKAILNNLSVECIPESLAIKISDYPNTEKFDKAAQDIRAIRPYIDSIPLCYQPLIYLAKANIQNKNVLGRLSKRFSPSFKKSLSSSQINEFKSKMINSDQVYIFSILESKSWKITAPLRLLAKIILKAKAEITYNDILSSENPSQLRHALESSVSWKITGPLRRVYDYVSRCRARIRKN